MIRVKLVHADAKLPFRANPTDAGADLFSVEDVVIPVGERRLIDTGIQIQYSSDNPSSCDPGLYRRRYTPSRIYHRIGPRSGLAAKHGIDVLAGVIDDSYRGNIKIILFNSGKEDFQITVGDRIAQLITEVCETHDFMEVKSLLSV